MDASALHQRTDGPSRDSLVARRDDLFAVLDHFPIPAEVFAADGSSLFVNLSFSESFQINADRLFGCLNILEDPYLSNEMGLTEYLAQVFSGATMSLQDVRVPLTEIDSRYPKQKGTSAGMEMYQDITCLPLHDSNGSVVYVVALFMTKHVYLLHPAVIRAREYIETHWLDTFDLDAIAADVGISRYHLSRLFRRFLGKTPYRHYQDVKIEGIKAALADPELSISEAFATCGVDYKGSFAGAFKRAVGATPSAYRRGLAATGGVVACPTGRVSSPPVRHRDEERLFQIADLLPIPVQIFRPNGEAAFINEAVRRSWNIPDTRQIVGNYNLLTDPLVNDRHGLRQYIERAFAGETVVVPDARLPLENFWESYQKGDFAFDAQAIYTDILNFPVRDAAGELSYVMSVFFTSRVYRGRSEVARVREYLENHWAEGFDAAALARLVNLSPAHLSRVFKKETGTTPYGYYQKTRLARLEAALRNPDLSISQAFSACGFDHQGNATRFFKDKVGMTPSQYRARALD